jgi:hypothetical protein
MEQNRTLNKPMLNKLEIIGVLLLFIPFWGPNSWKFSWGFPYMSINLKTFLKTFLILNEL